MSKYNTMNASENLYCPLIRIWGLVAIILSCSCSKDWIEAKVDKKQAVPSTLSDFQALMDNVTLFNTAIAPGLGEIAADGHYYTESAWTAMKGTNAGNAYTWSNDVPYNNSDDWNGPFRVVFATNIILEGLMKLDQGIDERRYRFIKGQALFCRSLAFYNLTQVYVNQFVESAADSDLGLPMRLSSDIVAKSKRSTLRHTYDVILSDVKKSVELLPEASEYLTRGNKKAALGLLARIYLSMERYDSAFVYAEKCLAIDNSLIDYSRLPLNSNFIGVNKEVFYLCFSLPTALTTTYQIDTALYNLYESDDLRRQLFFKGQQNALRFKGFYSNSANDVFCGLANDEMYLIKSECAARAGRVQYAMQILNELLVTRWRKDSNGLSTYVDKTIDDPDVALRTILVERKKQLILRNRRWSDLRRLNRDPKFSITLNRIVSGNALVLKPNDFQYTFPIPDDIVSNSDILQNMGW